MTFHDVPDSPDVGKDDAPPYFGRDAVAYRRAGYYVIPVDPGTKRPDQRGWPIHARNLTVKQVAEWSIDPCTAKYGIGVLALATPAIDIDVRHPEAADEIDAAAERILGPAPVRIGAWPKRLRVYSGPEDMPYTSVGECAFPGDDTAAKGYKWHNVEVLSGGGKQFVAAAIHPGTGKPYQWPSGDLLAWPHDRLTAITAEMVEAFLAEVRVILARHGAVSKGGRSAITSGGDRRTSVTGNNVGLSRVAEALAHVPNDADYHDWVRYAYALKGAFGEDGFDLWRDWSERSDKYDADYTETTWAGLKPRGAAGGVTCATILRDARRNGWVGSPEPDFPAPTMTADEAAADLRAALAPFFAAVPEHAARRQAALVAARTGDSGESDDDYGLVSGLADKLFDRPQDTDIPRWGAKVGAGIGKTEVAIRLALDLVADHPDILIAIMVPTHRLSDGIAARINAMAGKPVAAIWRGAEREDPENPGRRMCPNEEAAEVLRRAGGGRDALCVKGKGMKRVYCPFHPDHPSKPIAPCGYRRQESQVASIWIFAHAALTSPPPKVFKREGRDPFDVVIIDESPWLGMTGGVERPYGLTLDELKRGPKFDLGRKSTRINGKLVALSEAEREAARKAAEDAYRRYASLAAAIAEAATHGRLSREAFEAAGITATMAAEARKLALNAKHDLDSVIRPGMTKDEVDKATAQWADNNRRSVACARFWAGVVHLMDHAEPEACYLVRGTIPVGGVAVEGVRIRWREDIRPAWLAAPILHLDATMNPHLAEAFLPGFLVVAEAEAIAPHARRIQVYDSAVAYRKIAPGKKVTGKDAVTAANNAERSGLLLEIEAAALAAEGKRGLAIMPQDTEAHLAGIGMATPKTLTDPARMGATDVTHFGDFTGVDDWRDVAKVWTVSRPMVPVRVAEDIASVLFGRLPVPVEGDRYLRAEVVALGRGGSGRPMTADYHPDADAEAIRWQITDAPLIQAEARARSVRRTAANPVEIVIMTNVPLPIEIDEWVTWDSVINGVDPVGLMLARGLVPSNWAGVAGVCKELFGEAADPADAARQWFRDHPEIKEQLDSVRSWLISANIGETPIRDSYRRTTDIRTFTEYRYQTAGKRKGATILVDAERYPTAAAVAAAVTVWAGALAVCEPVRAKCNYMAMVALGDGRVQLSGDADMLHEWLSRPGFDQTIVAAVSAAQSSADLTG
ncbi:DNA primase/helicase phage-associated [Paramagnetospirillum magnetotacticum MS-1]|uniref:DNA primase/helicase phage-associated n=1 Tax=Paramagnetospirillum magnetotacticum MS-1 TaxID=272627 RepID=A0A0C2YY07_PARME|nr:PriCT-2 domain-containing protein [Paramagnetospirillum magnetotacticum]KIL99555.1 DNA primase/helicase phage-associated [Paramagnetospirillum magnetotacticum MS-1]